MNTKVIVLVAIVVIAIVALGAWYMFGQKWAAPAAAPEGLGSDIYGQVAPNAAEKLPETNPFKAESNPFKGVQTNPFGQ